VNILHLNTSDEGGAARAMIRLSRGLERLGHASSMLVGYRRNQEPGIGELKGPNDKVWDRVTRSLDLRFSLNAWSYRISWQIHQMRLFQQADIINLHNLHGGYFNYRALPGLAHHKPVVWTLHDMWALTGHCAYSYDCERWKTGCHHCPLLREPGRQIVEPWPLSLDRSRAVWNSKRDVYRKTPLHIVTPSKWLYGMVKSSILGSASSVHYVPYGVDPEVFHPSDRRTARHALGLPPDAQVIFFSAAPRRNMLRADHRKGLAYLLQALEQLPVSHSTWLLTSGSLSELDQYSGQFHVRQLGYVNDERLQQLAFAAADLFVAPSLADNLPLTLIEALTCGTPVVAFDAGGIPELVRHMETGYLARHKDAADLTHGIKVLLQDESLRRRMGQRGRKIAEAEYSLEIQGRRYVNIYEEVLKGTHAFPEIK
jgi:glycosyltransferase involved in cell wall biosynthesis